MILFKKLWGIGKFGELSSCGKYLLMYFGHHPNISIVGVIVTKGIEQMLEHTGLSQEEFRVTVKELIDNKLLYIEKYEGKLYFIIPRHFSSVPKNETTVLKFQRFMDDLPSKIKDKLDDLNIKLKGRMKEFVKPNVDELELFIMQEGYDVDATQVIRHYEHIADKYGRKGEWINVKGKPVKDWKATLRKVWFKDERKLSPQKNAPKGYEFFHIKKDNEIYYPMWKNDEPKHKDFLLNRLMKEKYDRLQEIRKRIS